jgi:hypothetical protein
MKFHDFDVIPTSEEVFAVIYARHKDMAVFSSFSDPTGTYMGGSGELGRMETVWGLRGAGQPLVCVRTQYTLDDQGSQLGPRQSDYFIVVATPPAEVK